MPPPARAQSTVNGRPDSPFLPLPLGTSDTQHSTQPVFSVVGSGSPGLRWQPPLVSMLRAAGPLAPGPAKIKQAPAISQAVIPDLPRCRKNEPSKGWKTAVTQWFEGDPENGLNLPLRDWPEEWHSGKMSRVTGSKYAQRRGIAMEYER